MEETGGKEDELRDENMRTREHVLTSVEKGVCLEKRMGTVA